MSQNPQTSLEQLEVHKKRLESINARRQKVQVALESARQQYEEAAKEALAAHKTADLDELRAILVKLEAENTAAVAEFVAALDGYDNFITRIEKALVDPEAMQALLSTMPEVEKVSVAPAAELPAAAGAAQPATAVAFDEDDI